MSYIRSGQTIWTANAVHSSLARPLLTDIDCEVLVIGGGVSGALIAHRLALHGADVVIVDRAQPSSGSTAACTALIQYDLDQPLIEVARQHSLAEAQIAYRACHVALDELQEHTKEFHDRLKFHPRSSVLLARKSRDEKPMRKEMDARNAIGIDVKWATEEELKSEWNINAPAGMISARSMELDPYALANCMLEKAVELGAKLLGPVEVIWDEAITDPDAKFQTIHTTHGPAIHAKYIVVATGYQTPAYVRDHFGKLVSTWAACSKPVADLDRVWPNRQLIWQWGPSYLYARTTLDQRVIFGGGDRGFKDAASRDDLTEKTIASLTKQINELVPGLSVEPEFKWSGTFGETPDGMPYIGCIKDRPGVYFALGFGGNGVTFSTIAARIIANTICPREDVSELAEVFGFDR